MSRAGPVWTTVTGAMGFWHQGKLFVEHAIAIQHDALHIIFGVIVWVVIAAVMRRPLSSRWPWLWLLAVIAWNETVDLWTEKWPDPGQQYGEGAKDLLLTMLLPTILAVLVRVAPGLFGAARRRR
ncbi:hypothetical protein [Sphingomonas sp. URHD0057]|uniref:hypothetical protein n=1 Tax=Sphingomonas sp. URHD0057 TaxID=1380389 RepID=UPI00048E7BDC|nr:hypothetical protein [Sphingomonas sp. URHD0057]